MNKIYRLITLFAVCFMAHSSVIGQTPAGTGKLIVDIFTDFHAKLNNTTSTTGFDVNRAFLGYNYVLDNNFSATVIVNGAGSPNDMKGESTRRRYAHLRDASLAWSNEKLKITIGLTETRLFYHQQRWWGKRYLAGCMQANHGYGFVSDLGIVLDYKFNDIFSGDITVMNGEGYQELQLDNNVRSSLGLTITPNQNFTFRVYGDHNRQQGLNQFTGVVFAGYKNKYFYIGADGSFKSNLDGVISGHDSWGFSTTSGVYLTEKDELFIRYDYATSVVASGETQQWNFMRDGTFTIIGLQHTFSPNVRMALNYQGTHPYSDLVQNRDMIYVNVQFKF